MKLRFLALYPDQMNIYADRGNVLFLSRRCEWRGIDFSYAAAGPGERIDPAAWPTWDSGPYTCAGSPPRKTLPT